MKPYTSSRLTAYTTYALPALSILLAVSACRPPRTSEQLRHYLQLRSRAYASQDYVEYHRLASTIAELVPQNYRYQYDLARACALIDDPQCSIRILHFLLDEGYDLALLAATDSAYDVIRRTPQFQDVDARIVEKTRPLNKSQIAFSIPEKDLIPEGIAYDPVQQTFYLGSVQKCKIISITKEEQISEFVGQRQNGLVKVLGLRVDADRRILWAVSSYGFFNPTLPENLLGTTGVFKFDLQTGQLLAKYMLPQEDRHMLNDLTVHSDGTVYVTDWQIPALYRISPDRNRIEKLVDLPRRPNGIDLSADQTRLFVGGSGIGVLDITRRRFTELKHPSNIYLSSDGLYYYQGSLIAVQNGGLARVTRFYLNESEDAVIRKEVLEAYHPLFDVPTTGAIVGHDFYFIANSQLRSFDQNGQLFPIGDLDETAILKLTLK
jgi:hypothetical protein